MSDAEPTKAVMPLGSPSAATLPAAMRILDDQIDQGYDDTKSYS